MQVINLFMWGYQTHFRATLKYLSERTLKLIGIDVEPTVFLVGLARPLCSSVHSVCIEPETGCCTLEDFSDLASRVENAIQKHPSQQIFYGDELATREKPENIRRLVISEEVKRILQLDDEKMAVQSFVSTAYPINDHYVVCVVRIPDRLFKQFSPIHYCWDGKSIETSFLHECLRSVLDEACRGLSRPDPGRDGGLQAMRAAEEVVRRAARNFMRLPFIGQIINTSDLFDRFNRLSQIMYEGRTGVGRIVLAAADDPNVQYVLRFATPVPFEQVRWARKALQMATKDIALIAGYDSIFGLGKITNVSAQPFCVDFLDHHHWDFKYRGEVLLRVRFGEARLPQEPIGGERFADNMNRIFPGITDEAVKRFKIILDLLMQLPHGSMLVIARDAGDEARRLEMQGTPIKPTALTRELLERSTSIDGTILADPEGVCHAIGVILDGTANEDCTPSRGARYNSAVRYVGNGPGERMAFVISEDRTLDIIPLLRERISRKEIEQAVDAIEVATLDNYHKPRSFLDDHRFYLSAQQCAVINRALDRIESESKRVGQIMLITPRFDPCPAMNDSYLKGDGEGRV